MGNFSLAGTTQSVISKNFIFQISKCSNETLNPQQQRCKSDAEITEYAKNIAVDSWSNYETISFSDHRNRPT